VRRRSMWLALGLVLAVTVTFGFAVQRAPSASAAAPRPCSSVAVVGLRGSGQTSGFGAQVNETFLPLFSNLLANNRTVASFALDYTAASTNLITNLKTTNYPWNVQQFIASANTGADSLYTLLSLRQRTCPGEALVLLGYSQGSMAIKLFLRNMVNKGESGILNRIAGIGLIADPTKNPNDPNIGSAAPLSRGIATRFGVGGAPVQVPASVVGYSEHACDSHDLVCDFSAESNTQVHSSYSSDTLRKLSLSLAPRVLRRSAPQPQPQPQPQPIFTVMNTSEQPPDGVWFRDNPNVSGPRLNGYGVYMGDRVQLQCFGWGQSIGTYGNRLWYRSANITRPNAPGRVNAGWLNAHYVNDGKGANVIDPGVPAC
jgi:hypothetical protein